MAAHIKWSFVESLETVSPQFAESEADDRCRVCNDQVFGRGCFPVLDSVPVSARWRKYKSYQDSQTPYKQTDIM